MAKKEAVAIDVRGSVPYEIGHIPGAVWAPLGLLGRKAAELPKDKLLVAYCTCKAEGLSLQAAEALRKLGYRKVAVLEGGYPAWVNAGFPVSRIQRFDDQPPPQRGTETLPAEDDRPPAARGRLAPPAAVRCSINEVTVYNGRALSYRRQKGTTSLRIRTDYGTTETVTLKHPGSSDPSRWFLLLGEPFKAADWKRIEVSRGVLRDGMRVNAWMCADGKAILDWRPDEPKSE